MEPHKLALFESKVRVGSGQRTSDRTTLLEISKAYPSIVR